jgi:hypothetical protein
VNDSTDRVATRRVFLGDSVAALVVSSPFAAFVAHHASGAMRTSPLKPASQYASEAAQFEAAFDDFATVASVSITTSTDIARLTSTIDRAAKSLVYEDSWMVAIGMRDSGLVALVKKTIRDDASLKRFVDSVKRDPKSIYANPEIAELSSRLEQLKLQKRALINKIVAQTRKMAGLEASSAEQAKKATDAQDCAKTWSIVAAVLAVVVAVVLVAAALATTVFSAATIESAAADLAARFRGTGAELVRSVFDAADQRYAQCVAAAKALSPGLQAKAVAACQVAWLAEKAAYIG